MSTLLTVERLTVEYPTDNGSVQAVDATSFQLAAGEKLGLVGESGSGKTTTALALMRMIRKPGRITAGRVVLNGVDLLGLDDEGMRQARLRDIAYVPQGAMNSLNPVLTIGDQLKDAICAHEAAPSKGQLRARIAHALNAVDLPAKVAGSYAHELSGGMKQRACIAIATVLSPSLVIADEPTSALDVVTQRQVMASLDKVRNEVGSALILIGHDMGLMAQFVDRVAVMYAGRLVEDSATRSAFKSPAHPYTQALISSVPTLHNKGKLAGLPSTAPALDRLPDGCAFAERCTVAQSLCRVERPDLLATGGRRVACHYPLHGVTHVDNA